MASTIGFGIPYSSKISNMMDLLIESKALVKSIKMKTEARLQKLNFSMVLSRVIWLRVVRPALRPFWLSLSRGSTFGMRQFRISLLPFFGNGIIWDLVEMSRQTNYLKEWSFHNGSFNKTGGMLSGPKALDDLVSFNTFLVQLVWICLLRCQNLLRF